jgi:hypothetical protein
MLLEAQLESIWVVSNVVKTYLASNLFPEKRDF